jgi:hypothetical protein
VKEGTATVRLARIHVAMPGKSFALMAVLKEAAETVKAPAGVDITAFGSMGAQVGESAYQTTTASLISKRRVLRFWATPNTRRW